MTDADDNTPSVETRLDAIAHRLEWINDDRLGIQPKLWVFMMEQFLAVSGAVILGFLVLGLIGVMSWSTVIGTLDTFLSLTVGGVAVLTFVERAASEVVDRRERSRTNRSLIETGTEDDP